MGIDSPLQVRMHPGKPNVAHIHQAGHHTPLYPELPRRDLDHRPPEHTHNSRPLEDAWETRQLLTSLHTSHDATTNTSVVLHDNINNSNIIKHERALRCVAPPPAVPYCTYPRSIVPHRGTDSGGLRHGARRTTCSRAKNGVSNTKQEYSSNHTPPPSQQHLPPPRKQRQRKQQQ